MRRVLKNKNFRLLIFGQFVSNFGNGLTRVSFVWFAYKTSNDPFFAGTVLGAQSLASFITRLPSGVFLDKFNKKKILITTDFLRGIVMAIIPILWMMGALNKNIFYLCAILLGILGTFFDTVSDILIPAISNDKDEIIKANSIYSSSEQFINMVGPALAGILIAITSAPVVMLIDAVTFLVSAASLLFLNLNKDFFIHTHDSKPMFDFFKEGLTFFLDKKILIRILSISAMVNITLAPIAFILSLVSEKVLTTGATALGFLMSGLFLGLFVGSLIPSFFTSVRRNPLMTNTLGIFSGMLAYFLLGISSTTYFAVFALFILGIGITPSNIINSSLWQILVPPEKKGRVFAFRRFISRSLDPVSIFVFSYLASLYSVVQLLIGTAIFLFFVMLFSIFLLKDLNSVMNFHEERSV